MTERQFKSEEVRLRRWAQRLGLLLLKSHGRRWAVQNRQGYMLVDPAGGVVVAGADFGLDQQGVADYLERIEQQRRAVQRA
jgi:hypothetical protein